MDSRLCCIQEPVRFSVTKTCSVCGGSWTAERLVEGRTQKEINHHPYRDDIEREDCEASPSVGSSVVKVKPYETSGQTGES